MDIRLICSDIDGTLLNSNKTVSSFDKQMIQKAYKEKGIPFALVSGRFLGGILPIEEQLGIPCIHSCFNGAFIEWNGKIINDIKINKKSLLSAYEIVKSFNVVPVLFDNDFFYMEEYGSWYDNQVSWSGKCGIVKPFNRLLDEHNPYKLITKSEDPAEILKLEKAINKVNIPDIDVFRSSPYILEFVPRGIDKANTVYALAEYLGIKKDNVMAFGDFNNDINMLKVAGYGIAMGNAIDEVKKIAFATTASCDECGIGKAIEKYLFSNNQDNTKH